MKISGLLKGFDYEIISGTVDKEVSKLIYDSRKADETSVFVCVKGAVSDGHDYIAQVVEKNVAGIVVMKDSLDKVEAANISKNICVVCVDDTRFALANMSVQYFGNPASKLKTIGITGTKGKTTTTYMIKSMLDMAGIKTGLIGTIETIIGDEVIKSKNTTPESYVLQEYFSKMVEAGCQAVVMEVSSQGLKYNRVAGFEFDYGMFSNLSPDHIGPNEHDDFEDYMSSKAKLFSQCKIGIVNADDKYTNEIIKNAKCEIESFGFSENADLVASDVELTYENKKPGVKYHLSGLMDFDVNVNIPGKFSVYNSLMAISLGRHFGISIDTIKESMTKLFVKGRVEIVPIGNKNFTMIIDYAHNAMSVESLLTTIKEYNPKRLICIFGCGGNRDKQRRYDMGSICAKMSELCILTTDNPRFEEPESIMNDILVGVNKENGKYIIINDRAEAIKYAYDNAQENDIIMMIGKGHENYQEIKGEKLHFDEREVIAELVSENK